MAVVMVSGSNWMSGFDEKANQTVDEIVLMSLNHQQQAKAEIDATRTIATLTTNPIGTWSESTLEQISKEINQESPFAIIGRSLYGTKKSPTNLWLEMEKMSVSVVGYSPHCEVEIIAMCPSMIGHGDGNQLVTLNNNSVRSANGVVRVSPVTIGQQSPEVIYIGDNLVEFFGD